MFNKKIKFLILLIIINIIDFFIKFLIINNIKLNEKIYITSFLDFLYFHNYGIFFGLLNYDDFFLKNLIIFLTTINLFFFIKQLIKEKKYNILYLLIISSTLNNILSRIYYGFIIDFIDLHIKNLHFIFNFSDLIMFISFFIVFKNYFIWTK